ncbi:MAG: SAM-dependent methyltransferase [Candidatus Daviesbacteria bacterium]|nr:SAM-dependent methyltransferase [Candidatus Daviesbacteria bacterium]
MASDLFVSRGGEKLQAALDQFKVDVSGKTILDVGSSTGGFVDCLLQNGAKKVYALDTAYGELAWKLRNDERVVVMERTNILHLTNLPPSVIASEAKQSSQGDNSTQIASSVLPPRNDEKEKVDLVTIDAGWTKLELVLPAVEKFLKPDGIIIALLKPHYEAEKSQLVKGVLPAEAAEQVKNKVINEIGNLGFKTDNQIDSPILGGAGNKEFLLFVKRKGALLTFA